MKNFILKTSGLFALMVMSTLMLSAQKLPNTQEKPVAIPADVKIDATLNEWNNKPEAYNKSTDVYYTLAHDKQNLYLAVQATDAAIIKKIMAGGIRLTICPSGDRKDPNPLVVTFPVLPGDYKSSVAWLLGNLITIQKDKGNVDSASNALNKMIATGSKRIKVKGFKPINDSLINIKNDFGLMAASMIDNNAVFTCELMVPLELIGPIAHKEIAYNITLSGEPAVVRKASAVSVVSVTRTSSSTDNSMSLVYPTDFWAKYKLSN